MAIVSNQTAEALRSTAIDVQEAYDALLVAIAPFEVACDQANREVQAAAPGQYVAAGIHVGVPNSVLEPLASRQPINLPSLVESAWAGKLPAA